MIMAWPHRCRQERKGGRDLTRHKKRAIYGAAFGKMSGPGVSVEQEKEEDPFFCRTIRGARPPVPAVPPWPDTAAPGTTPPQAGPRPSLSRGGEHQVSNSPVITSADDALAMLQAAMGYLAAADP